MLSLLTYNYLKYAITANISDCRDLFNNTLTLIFILYWIRIASYCGHGAFAVLFFIKALISVFSLLEEFPWVVNLVYIKYFSYLFVQGSVH